MSLRLQDALAYHGLTREITSSELIQYLGSLRLEDAFLYDMMVRDPPDIAGRIAGWDFLFSTGMTTECLLRRNWNTWLAMRELVQNALNIEDNTFGYENIRINVYLTDIKELGILYDLGDKILLLKDMVRHITNWLKGSLKESLIIIPAKDYYLARSEFQNIFSKCQEYVKIQDPYLGEETFDLLRYVDKGRFPWKLKKKRLRLEEGRSPSPSQEGRIQHPAVFVSEPSWRS